MSGENWRFGPTWPSLLAFYRDKVTAMRETKAMLAHPGAYPYWAELARAEGVLEVLERRAALVPQSVPEYGTSPMVSP